MKEALTTIGIAVGAIVIGVLVYLYGNFGGPSPSAVTNPNAAAITVQFTKIVAGLKSSVATRTNYLITSEDQFKKLWNMVDATTTLPTIDFNTYSVIGVFAGKGNSAAYTVKVSKVEDTTKRNVTVSLTKPDSACAGSRGGITPYELVLVALSSLPLDHNDIVTTTGCPAAH